VLFRCIALALTNRLISIRSSETDRLQDLCSLTGVAESPAAKRISEKQGGLAVAANSAIWHIRGASDRGLRGRN
jgi:hypothetical protein